ncbi:hypothetical protein IWQ61_003308 [Dispira simplex]|nr:hypothetical protein IWQ61_003308 [Dispira simplex]
MVVSSAITTASGLPATTAAEKNYNHTSAATNTVSTTASSVSTLDNKVRKKPGRKPNPNALEIRKDKNRQAQRDYRRRREAKIHNLEHENGLLKNAVRVKDNQIRRLEMQLFMLQGEGRPLAGDPPFIGDEHLVNSPHYTVSPTEVEEASNFWPHPSLSFGGYIDPRVTSINSMRASHWESSATDMDLPHVPPYDSPSRSPSYHQFSSHHLSPSTWPTLSRSTSLNQPRHHLAEDMPWSRSSSTQADRRNRPIISEISGTQGPPRNLGVVCSSPLPSVDTNTLALPYHSKPSRQSL